MPRSPGNALFYFVLLLLAPHPALAELQITIHPDPDTAIDNPIEAEREVDATPGNAQFADQKEWSTQRADTVKDVTDYMPGIIDQPRDGAESNRLSIRGSGLANIFQGEGLLVLQDGIPINMADGEFEFPMIDPWLIRYAKVFPGANALQYGGSTFGGAINFITPTGTSEPGYGVRGEGGSFGTGHTQLTAGRQWKDGDLFAAATGFLQEGFRQQNEQQTGRLNANWGWQISDHFSNRVYLSHTISDAEIPGAITLAQTLKDPRVANPTNLANDYQRNLDITRIADKSAWTDGADRIDSTLFYTFRRLDNPVTTYEFQHNNDTGIMEKYTHRYSESQWLLGFNDYYGDANEVRYQDNAATPGALILRRNLYALTSEAFAELDQQLAGKLHGIAGIQGTYALRDIHQGYPTLATQNDHFTGVNPKIGLRYDWSAQNQWFANISRSFNPPSWSDLSGGNTPGFHQLKSQRADTAEVGARGQLHALHWQAAYYHSWVRDELVNYEFASDDTATINAARTRKDGIELGMDGDAAHDVWLHNDAIALRAAYTFSHFTMVHDPLYGNNIVPGVPEHYLRAEALYHLPCGISFGPNAEWSPQKAPVDLANTLYAPAYAIFGARAFWESDDHTHSIYIEGRNLLDKHYVATYNVIPNAAGADGRNFYPGEGLAIYAGVKWTL